MRKALLLFFSTTLFLSHVLAQGPGCPNINAGPDQTLPCNVNCTTLSASLFQTGATTSYSVTAIPYNPPAPSTAWTNTFVNIDDRWSGVINLPFSFCYYGNVYNQLVVGANGVISFNTGYANGFCPWSFAASVPSSALPLNAIFGAYHDIDPSVCGQIRYAISGSFPCRTFMFDFASVCHYSCNNLQTSQRIVLYETSNAIEVYIGNKPTCGGWNGGRAVIGIQNGAGSQGVVAPGRQTGPWSASNEAWRFTPSGAPNYQVQWFSSTSPGIIGTGTSVNVCPTSQFTTYSAILTYTNCNNAQVVVSDYVNVTLSGPAQPPIFNNTPCPGQTLTLNTNAVPGATYVWSGPGGWTSNAQSPTRPNATAGMSGTYNLYVVVAGCTSSVASKNILILSGATLPTFTVNNPICSGTTLNFNAPTYPGATYVWSGPGGWNPGNVEDPVRTNVTSGGMYSLYVVAGGCTSATATQNVTVNSVAAPVISSNSPVCTQNTINLFGPTIAGATYVWSGPGGWSSSLEDPSIPNANTNMSGTYSLYTVIGGCTSATSTVNVVVNGPPIPFVNIPQEVCAGTNVTLLSGNYPGATYVWTGPNGFTSSSANPTINNISAAGTGTYNLYLVQSGCTSITVSSYLNVISVPTPSVGSNSPICQGNTINLSSNTIAGATYHWSGPNGYASSAEDPSIPNATPTHSGTYSLYAVAGGCTSVTSSTSVTVHPTPSANSVGNQTLCNGESTNAVNFSGPVPGTVYNWTNSNPSIGLAAGGTGDIGSFTAVNNTNAPIISTINVTPTANGCPGPVMTFTITVNPTPSVTSIGNQTWCHGATTTVVTPSGPVLNSSFSWINSNPSIGLAVSGFGNIPSFTATNPTGSPISATIAVIPTANGCPGTPVPYTVTVNPSPSVNPIPNQTICRGNMSTLVVPAGGPTGTTYTWTNDNAAIGLASNGNGNIPSFMGTNTGTAPITGTITVTPTANGCTGTPTTFTITVNPTPTVNSIGPQNYCPNVQTAVISPTGPVNGTTFSWTSSNPAIGLASNGNGDIPSFTTSNPGNNNISSTVTVTPTANGCQGTPTSFFITVGPTPTVTAIPNQTVCHGANTTAVNPSGNMGSSNYSWTNSDPSIGLAAGGNGAIPAFTAVNNGTAPVTATITVTPTANNCVGTPTSFTITVRPTPNVYGMTDQTVCNGASTTLVDFNGDVANTTFNWVNNTPSIGLAASGTGDIPPFTAANNGTAPVTATITVTPTANGCTGTPATFTMTVNPTPSVDNITDQTLCNGTATNLVDFNGSVPNTNFDWTNNDASIGLAAAGSGDIASFNAVNNGTAPVTATITVTPTANNCVGPDNTFTITVNPTPLVNSITNQVVCNGAPTANIDFNSGTANTGFSWTNDMPGIGLAANGTGDIASFNAVNAGTAPVTATITVTPTADNCAGTPGSFTITVNPTPTVDNVNDQTLCNGDNTAAIDLDGPVANSTFDWTNNDASIGLAANGSGDIASFVTVNNGTAPVTATVTVTPSANGCSGTPETFAITVNPTPTVDNIPDQILCNGATATAIDFDGPVNGTTYAWVNDEPSIGLAASGNGDITAFTATNTGTAPVIATITATPTANGCSGTPETFTITVNPTPTVDNIPDQVLCNGATAAAIDFDGPVNGTTYAWVNDEPSIGLAANGIGDIASFVAVNNGTAPVTATITVTPTANGCVGTPNTFSITVNPTPTADNVNDQTLCNGDNTAAIDFDGPVSNSTFDWTNDTPSIGLAAGGSGDIAPFTAVNNGTAPITATITVTPTANNCVGTPNTFTITVNPTPIVNAIANQTYCNGATTNTINISSATTGTAFDWTNSNTGIGLAANGSGSPIPSFTATNAGNSAITATITVTPTANNCVGTASSFDITVNPTPTVDAVNDQILCNGDPSAAINFNGTVNGTTFDWTNNNTSTGLGASGTGDIASFTSTNGGASPITSTVTVTPAANNCTGTAIDFDITVNPTHTGLPVDATICDGDTYTFGGQGFTTAGSYPVVFQNAYGCDSTVTLNLTVIPASGPPPGSTFFNTGTNGLGGTLPGGSPDANWTVATGSINGPYVPATVMSSIPGNYYSSPWPDCEWISHSANGSHSVNTDYFYRIDFDLPCFSECGQSYLDPNVFCLNLDFFADNSVYEIYINDVPQSGQLGNMPVPNPYTAVGFNQAGMVSASFCDGWQPGSNSIIVHIVSGPGYAGFLSQMSVNPPPPMSDTTTATICDNETLNFGTQTLSAAGTYTETFLNVNGCDSVVTLILSVNPTFTGTENGVICDGDLYSFGGQDYTVAGSYPVVFQTVNGCDSTVTLNLTVNPTYASSFQQTICDGASVTFGGTPYSTSGNYPVTFTSIHGCDSMVTLELTVTPNPDVVINPQADQCFNGNSFDFSLAQAFGPTTTYNWTFTGANTTTSSDAAPQNISYPGAGQYTVSVTVTENGCQSNGSLNVNVLTQPDAQFNALPPAGCTPLTVQFDNITGGGGDISWTFTGGNPSTSTVSPVNVVYNTPGQYTVSLTVTYPNGCADTETVPNLINVQSPPVAGFTIQPLEVNMGNPVASFIDGSTGASNVYYYVGDDGSGTPGPDAQYHFTEEGTYDVMQVVTSSGGCMDTAYGQLVVIGSTEVFIPNAFTPNADPTNPGFGVVGNGFTDFHMMIFNRWGELLFESLDENVKWDGTYGGKPVPLDVYVYKVELRDYKKTLRTYIGHVTLLR